MAKQKLSKIYEVNDVFSVFGYSLLFLGGISQYTSMTTAVIPVDSFLDVVKGLFNTDATGNLLALGLGAGALLIEKYIKYGTIGIE